MDYLLDTNSLSEPMKPKPNAGYSAWLETVDESTLYTSCLVLGELQRGISRLGHSKRRTDYQAFLNMAIVIFGDRILIVDTQTCLRWGELTAAAAKAGRTLPQVDSLIAAQCLQHDMTLVTRNTKDFEQFEGLKLLNPWS